MAVFEIIKDFQVFFKEKMCWEFIRNKICRNAYIAKYQFQNKRVRKFKQIFL